MINYQDEPYSNEYQQQAVERLHQRVKHTAVVASGNSEIVVYLTRQSIYANDVDLYPYNIEDVQPLPDCSEFQCKVILRADWSSVDDV